MRPQNLLPCQGDPSESQSSLSSGTRQAGPLGPSVRWGRSSHLSWALVRLLASGPEGGSRLPLAPSADPWVAHPLRAPCHPGEA